MLSIKSRKRKAVASLVIIFDEEGGTAVNRIILKIYSQSSAEDCSTKILCVHCRISKDSCLAEPLLP